MSEPQQPIFLVSAYTDPVIIQINGKANYLNCNAFREFIEKMLDEGNANVVLDLEYCAGMDSTFLGILAGTALELRRKTPVGILIICNLSERNKELVFNLGLHNLLTIDKELEDIADKANKDNFAALNNVEVSDAREVLKAHENLVKADKKNATKFQDVIAFLQNQAEAESEAADTN